jgi:hypothetical protein
MVSFDGFIENTYNFGILLTTLGVLGELRNRKEDVSKCLTANGNIGLTLIAMGTTAKIYMSFTN